MVTFGIGEAIAVAQLAVQVVELGQKCAESIERWQAYGEDAGRIYLKFNHENRRLKSLQHLLVDKDKIGLGKPLFELMEPQQQKDVQYILMSVLKLLHGFQDQAARYNLTKTQPGVAQNVPLSSLALDMQALEDALPEMRRRDKWLQTTSTFTTKWRWTFGAKTDAEKLVAGIREWLDLITEEIDLQMSTLANPAPPTGSLVRSSAVAGAHGSRWQTLEVDPDIIVLNLAKSMRIRNYVVQLQATAQLPAQPFPKHLLLDTASIRVGTEVQHNRHIASMTKGTTVVNGLVEFRPYRDSPDEIQRAMENLCMVLYEASEQSFRLPKPDGIFRQEGSEKRFGLFFPLSSIGASGLDSIWTLQRILAPSGKDQKPSIFKSPPLEARFELALRLATALCKTHSVGWYYQGLHSRNICLITQSTGSTNAGASFDSPFLFGFTKSRAIDDSVSYDDGDIVANTHRHPDRWEPDPKRRHHALDDLYSLGVVLLEIGCWTGLPELLSSSKGRQELDLSSWTAHGVRNHLLKWAKSRLAHTMGTAYQSLVVALLQAHSEDLDTLSWQSWPAHKRLLFVTGALRELCSGLNTVLDMTVPT
ncbi:hypothetical protein LTR09_010953 [Extremus antarcticus]|uniref:Prion-inhibition and propagation HeLo domain-containing protein n=1 Tax=Extremus antarcticus TaxID=702011 RepID=A0AAJ0G5B0_9PEZI|nr:hypothetical protein LTR09_010953 [Extremus antarcticus]